MKELREMTEVELLRTHGAVVAELRSRKVVRTNNHPVGDYAEWLVCNRLGLHAQGNSQSAFDAEDDKGTRYQIKGRVSDGNSVQFSAIRNLDQQGFDFVIAVIFSEDYSVRLALRIPYDVVPKLARYQAHTNSHRLILTSRSVEQEGVEDISYLLSDRSG